jgi:hypothetical protein
MASTMYVFNSFRKYVGDGTLDLDTDNVKLGLLSNAYSINTGHTVWTDVSSAEVANGNGYTTGGILLANKILGYTGATGKWSADNPVFSALTKTFRWALLYANKTVGPIVDPLILAILLDNTPADIVVSGADYSIQWHPTNGILTIT